MGQYHLITNPKRKEILHPYGFGEGLKFLEFGTSQASVLTGLAYLLSDSSDRSGGDIHFNSETQQSLIDICGSWSEDPIVIAGDYADPLTQDQIKVFGLEKMYDKLSLKMQAEAIELKQANLDIKPNMYRLANDYFTDIGPKVLACIVNEEYVAEGIVDLLTCHLTAKYISLNLAPSCIMAAMYNPVFKQYLLSKVDEEDFITIHSYAKNQLNDVPKTWQTDLKKALKIFLPEKIRK